MITAIERAIEKAGSQDELARRVKVSQGLVSQWVNGAKIELRHFPEIERATDGDVTAEQLLADELEKLKPKRRQRSN
jgi:DNA-binding transcriptional regulator YdaS (Cro superfamily)